MPEAQPLRGLYAITPERRDDPRYVLRLVGEALRGGARFVQYRDKQNDAQGRVGMARALLTLCHSAGARLLVNDDLQLALTIGADGVHLGAGDGDLRAARQALPAGLLLGASCYADFSRARAAA